MAGRHRVSVSGLITLALAISLVPDIATATDGSWRGRGPAVNGWGVVGVYDPVRQRMVAFGGQPAGVVTSNSSPLVWELTLNGTSSWTVLTTIETLGPYGRQSSSAIYDPLRDRMIIFGGQGGSTYNDVWAFSLGTHSWSNITPSSGPAPVPRQGHSAIYDPVRDRMLVFGGSDAFNVDKNDVWALSLDGTPAWTQLAPAGMLPHVRSWHSAIYDSARDRMVIFAGWTWTPQASYNDAWSLSLAGTPTWSAVTASGGPVAIRNSHNAVYDPIGDRMVVFGAYEPDLTVLDFGGSPAWSTIMPAGTPPSGRDGTVCVYDAPRHRLAIFGGIEDNLGSAWAVTLGASPTWSPIAAVGTPSTVLGLVVRDTTRDRLVVLSPDLSIWSRPLAGEPAWTQQATSGDLTSMPPQPSMIYDPPRDRLVLHGGDETYALSLSTLIWSRLVPPGMVPSWRHAHSAIYDAPRDRMVIYGGAYGPLDDLLEEIWALPLSPGASWVQLTPVNSEPIGRDGHTAIFDPVGDRMVICGGHDGFGTFRRDVWAFDLDSLTWTEITPNPALPHDVVWMSSVYDASRRRMLMFGGRDLVNGGNSNELWSLALSGAPVWTLLNPSGLRPVGRQNHGAIYDPIRDRMVVYGGINGSVQFPESWEYTPGATTEVPDGSVPAASGLALGPPRPNPSREPTVLAFTLAQAGRVTLEIFDAGGRIVRRLVDAEYSPGSHTATWAGDDDRGRSVSTGLYFARVTSGGKRQTTRIARVR